MHSKDKTLIASLGFSDPDKGELHDRACFFCTTEAFAAVIDPSAGQSERWHKWTTSGYTAQLEYPIKEGYGIVGFADVYMTFDLLAMTRCHECKEYRHTSAKAFKVLIEVKTQVGSVGDWVRQINLYRTKMPVDLAVLACVQSIPDAHQLYLRQANIMPISFRGMSKNIKLNREFPTCKCPPSPDDPDAPF